MTNCGIGRIVCAIIPFGADEGTISRNVDSNSIIGYDQFLLARASVEIPIVLYENDKSYNDDDVLLIISTIWAFPLEEMKKFRRVVYFYDDNCVAKAKTERYKDHLRFVNLVFHPDPAEVDDFQKFWNKPTFYLPYSSGTLPSRPINKPVKPSFFVDLDRRMFITDTVGRGFEFIEYLKESNFDFFVPHGFKERMSSNIISIVKEIPRLSHEEFLIFLSGMTYYVTGIFGSYEYVILESALLGCGLISLYNSVRRIHKNRPFVIDYPGGGNFSQELHNQLEDIDPNDIIASANKLYPQNAIAALPELIMRTLPTT